MGKKLDALLGKSFKASKFKAMANMAISRLAVLKNQRQARCSIARSDVVELLTTANHERALLRVEQVIKEQNMLDVFVVLESYCHLLIERVNLIAQEKVCPEELKEAVSSLIFAATRCGEFPELQEIRLIFTSRFGKEFASRAIELRNHCGVNPKIIQKLSTRTPSLETKMKVLKEIASENNIVLQIDSATTEGNQDPSSSSMAPSGMSTPRENKPMQFEDIEMGEEFSGSGEMRRKYRDVADAAQAAFESAAYAAAAARAAVELSRSQSTDPDDPTSPNNRPRKVSATVGRMKSDIQTSEENIMGSESETEVKIEKIHPIQNSASESITGTVGDENGVEKFKQNDPISDSEDNNVDEMNMASKEEGHVKTLARDVVFDESDNEDQLKGKMPRTYNVDADEKNDSVEGSSRKFHHSAHSPLRSSAAEPLNINRRPISVRTKWAHVR